MTIHYVMLIALGFLAASFIVLLLAPAFWARAVRLTSARLRESMPATETEIRADKDKLRADYAMKLYRLESRVDQAKLGAARQLIELNRRDATISDLEAKLGAATSSLEENQNARRVLEQTITEKLPRVELHLDEARRLLAARDDDISALSDTARRQQDALVEARAIVEKQTGEIERLASALFAAEAGARRAGGREADFDTELALRNELEAVRARARDQASTIDRLQAEISMTRLNSPTRADGAENGQSRGDVEQLARLVEQGKEVDRLRAELEAAQAALQDAKSKQPATAERLPAEVEQELRSLRARGEDQAAEITRLKAELDALAKAGEEKSSLLRDNRFNLKAKLSGLEAKSEEQGRTIQRLRVELAAANERSARHAVQLREEMKRAGVAAHLLGKDTQSLRERNSQRIAERAAQVLRAGRYEEVRSVVAAVESAEASHQSDATKAGSVTLNGAKSVQQPITGEKQSANGAEGRQAEDQDQVVFLPTSEGGKPQKPAQSEPPAPRRSRLLDRLAAFSKG
ncbi:MAG: hypothetical protein F9K44_00610 [Hyphomicrobiaceae bacterium]|nr:MAG: hypothetical protein F9K44_00610 [Hyphomicrobiaceae bacterium]